MNSYWQKSASETSDIRRSVNEKIIDEKIAFGKNTDKKSANKKGADKASTYSSLLIRSC